MLLEDVVDRIFDIFSIGPVIGIFSMSQERHDREADDPCFSPGSATPGPLVILVGREIAKSTGVDILDGGRDGVFFAAGDGLPKS